MQQRCSAFGTITTLYGSSSTTSLRVHAGLKMKNTKIKIDGNNSVGGGALGNGNVKSSSELFQGVKYKALVAVRLSIKRHIIDDGSDQSYIVGISDNRDNCVNDTVFDDLNGITFQLSSSSIILENSNA